MQWIIRQLNNTPIRETKEKTKTKTEPKPSQSWTQAVSQRCCQWLLNEPQWEAFRVDNCLSIHITIKCAVSPSLLRRYKHDDVPSIFISLHTYIWLFFPAACEFIEPQQMSLMSSSWWWSTAALAAVSVSISVSFISNKFLILRCVASAGGSSAMRERQREGDNGSGGSIIKVSTTIAP